MGLPKVPVATTGTRPPARDTTRDAKASRSSSERRYISLDWQARRGASASADVGVDEGVAPFVVDGALAAEGGEHHRPESHESFHQATSTSADQSVGNGLAGPTRAGG